MFLCCVRTQQFSDGGGISPQFLCTIIIKGKYDDDDDIYDLGFYSPHHILSSALSLCSCD